MNVTIQARVRLIHPPINHSDIGLDMRKLLASEARAAFEQGDNVMALAAKRGEDDLSSIHLSYDAQAGSYTKLLDDDKDFAAFNAKYVSKLANVLNSLDFESMLDAGTGEASTLAPLLPLLPRKKTTHAIDISVSRLLYARRYLESNGVFDVELIAAELGKLPFASNSIDLVMTTHAVEPNRGKEKEILGELLRVARLYLVLIEPSYELSSPEGQARMDRLSYVRDLPETLSEMGHKPITIERWPNYRELNAASLIVVEKKEAPRSSAASLISPISGMPLKRGADCYYCPSDGYAFPIVAGIPCLTAQNGIIASHLPEFMS